MEFLRAAMQNDNVANCRRSIDWGNVAARLGSHISHLAVAYLSATRIKSTLS